MTDSSSSQHPLEQQSHVVGSMLQRKGVEQDVGHQMESVVGGYIVGGARRKGSSARGDIEGRGRAIMGANVNQGS